MALYEGMYDRAAGASGLLYLSVDGKGSRATVTVRAGKKGSRAAIRVISRNFKWGGGVNMLEAQICIKKE